METSSKKIDQQDQGCRLQISYMGTKAQLLEHLRPIIASSKPGPLLDVFSGMCSVGRTFSAERPIWTNDLLIFPAMVGRLLFTATTPVPRREAVKAALSDAYLANMARLKSIYRRELNEENALFSQLGSVPIADRLLAIFDQKYRLPTVPSPGRLDIFTRLYGGIYFGHRQAIEIDSLRVAIQNLDSNIDEIDPEWLILALAIAMGKCASTTGHFAQPLTPKASNSARIIRQRARSVYSETMGALVYLKAVWNGQDRKKNRSYGSDALELLNKLSESKDGPAVIYADPPYTKDQYSRFYHIYDTLVSYEEPGCSGKGRYSSNRPTSSFSSKRRARNALRELIRLSATNDATLVLSYPSNGIVEHSADFIPEEIHAHFGRYPKVLAIDHMHSTMGGSKGAARSGVREHIYRVAA